MGRKISMAHILVVDDDRATVSLLTLLLEMDGFQVSQSPQPQTAFELAKAGAVDAFIIDCHPSLIFKAKIKQTTIPASKMVICITSE